jgi:hypothetical protein
MFEKGKSFYMLWGLNIERILFNKMRSHLFFEAWLFGYLFHLLAGPREAVKGVAL